LDADGIEVWRGGVNAWDCDQMGHLNVRHYVAASTAGLAGLAAALGRPAAFAARAESTLVLREHHIRFFREARVGDSLAMRCGVLAIEAEEALLLQTLRHAASGEVSAIFQTRIAHVRSRDGQAFPWPQAARAAAGSLAVQVPEGRGPRSLPPGPRRADAGLDLADRLQLPRHGLGLFLPAHCDAFGRVLAAEVMGRLSDAGAFAAALVRAAVGGRHGGGAIGMAVVEYRLAYLDWPAAGDRYELRSAWTEVEPRRIRFEHWLLDPASGRPWAVAEVVLVVFDLDARKAITLPDEAVAELRKQVVRIG
jgi:acyl-CoA thioester hydrolase